MYSFLVIASIIGITSCQHHQQPMYGYHRNIRRSYDRHHRFEPDPNELDPHQTQKALKDVRSTISEVQRLLATDPNLPRLTR